MTFPVPANPVTLKKLADQVAAKEAKDVRVEGGEVGVKEDKPKEDRKKKEEPKEEETIAKKDDGVPASWLKPVKWFLGQYAKESGDRQWKLNDRRVSKN